MIDQNFINGFEKVAAGKVKGTIGFLDHALKGHMRLNRINSILDKKLPHGVKKHVQTDKKIILKNLGRSKDQLDRVANKTNREEFWTSRLLDRQLPLNDLERRLGRPGSDSSIKRDMSEAIRHHKGLKRVHRNMYHVLREKK